MQQEQALFIIEKFLNRYKGNFELVDKDSLPVIEQILYEAGKQFNLSATQILERSGNIDKGGLFEINAPLVYKERNGYALEVGYPVTSEQAKYYDYINQGVRGVGGKNSKRKYNTGKYTFKSKKVGYFLANVMQKWAERASLSIRTENLDLSKTQRKRRKIGTAFIQSQDRKKLGFLIATAVKRDGIKGNLYFDKSVKKVFNKEFVASLEKALKADVTIQIRSLYGNNNS